MAEQQNIYGGNDPRDIAAYTVAEAAHYVRIPPQTLRSWVAGRSDSGRLPLISIPEYDPPRLSFNNLIEAYTLRALRIKHQVSIRAAREAINFAERAFTITRLFLHPRELRTGAGQVLLEKYGEFVNLNRSGQIAIAKFLEEHLNRIELDDLNLPIRLYPFETDTNKIIAIDPRIAFGRPIIASRGISTMAIIDRVNAGEREEEIAEDYGLEVRDVEEAIVCEQAA